MRNNKRWGAFALLDLKTDELWLLLPLLLLLLLVCFRTHALKLALTELRNGVTTSNLNYLVLKSDA